MLKILILILLFSIVTSSRKERYEKLRGVVQLRKQATIQQFRKQERECEEFQRQILKDINIVSQQRNTLLEEWKEKHKTYENVKQLQTHVQTVMSLLKHIGGFQFNNDFSDSMNFHQIQLEEISQKLDPEIEEEIRKLKISSHPTPDEIYETHHQLQHIMKLIWPIEKKQEQIRLDYSSKILQLNTQLKNLQEQLELNNEAQELDQYELEKDLMLHFHEIELLDSELLKMKKEQVNELK